MNPFWRDLLLAVAITSLLPTQTEWPVYGYDSSGSRYSPVGQITASNVMKLQRAWTYHTGEKPAVSGPRGQRQVAFETTPLVIGSVLYLTTPANRVIALDATSGRPQGSARHVAGERAESADYEFCDRT